MGDKDDRDRKSWREIDKSRDGSRRRDEREAPRTQGRSATAYSRYKSDAEAFFKTGVASERMQAVAPGLGAKKREQDQAVSAVLNAEGAPQLLAAYQEFRKTNALPPHPDFLVRALQLTDPAIQAEVLARLLTLAETNQITRKATLQQRAFLLAQTTRDDKVRALAQRLHELLSA